MTLAEFSGNRKLWMLIGRIAPFAACPCIALFIRNPEKLLYGLPNLIIFAIHIVCGAPIWGQSGREYRHDKSVYLRLFLTIRNLANSLIVVRNEATIGVVGMITMRFRGRECHGVITYHHTAWGSALLVRLQWAMLRPRIVGRVTGTDSHAFSYPLKSGDVYRVQNINQLWLVGHHIHFHLAVRVIVKRKILLHDS